MRMKIRQCFIFHRNNCVPHLLVNFYLDEASIDHWIEWSAGVFHSAEGVHWVAKRSRNGYIFQNNLWILW